MLARVHEVRIYIGLYVRIDVHQHETNCGASRTVCETGTTEESVFGRGVCHVQDDTRMNELVLVAVGISANIYLLYLYYIFNINNISISKTRFLYYSY